MYVAVAEAADINSNNWNCSIFVFDSIFMSSLLYVLIIFTLRFCKSFLNDYGLLLTLTKFMFITITKTGPNIRAMKHMFLTIICIYYLLFIKKPY